MIFLTTGKKKFTRFDHPPHITTCVYTQYLEGTLVLFTETVYPEGHKLMMDNDRNTRQAMQHSE